MDTYNTLEEIKVGFKSSLFDDDNKWELRPEQRDAIDRAKDRFCKRSGTKGNYVWSLLPNYKQYLWNAKMRFGKTICALQLAREMGVKRTLIVTHRPVVNKSWKDDFDNVFGDQIIGNSDVKDSYAYGTLFDDEQHDKKRFYDLEKFVKTEGNHYVFFVSMQYLRLSELVNAKTLLKNKDKQHEDHDTKENEKLKADILSTDWDFVVVDEAHEGTRTALGKRVIDEYLGHKEKNVKVLHLSGTPFNLYEDFKEEEIFTWDYVSEQQAKLEWNIKHPNETNPYAELPKMNIFTYDITNNIKEVVDHDGVFTFNEFLRTWTGNPKADKAQMPQGAKGRFVHEEDVKKFLQLLCTKDATNNFPFSTTEYRQQFRHTLWVVSHVDEAAALTQLLREHPIFKRFEIVNVAGKGDIDEQNENALDAVNNAIGELPEKTSTITISCGRLTTGVTVRPWSAVLYLKGGDGAATYMQTIFRVQSPYKTPDGKMKTSCYVFDFAPDRTLKIVAETAKFSSMAKAKEKKEEEGDEEKTQELRDKETVNDFIALCPVISMDGGKMSPLDVNTIYKQLENVFIDRLVRKGFDDPCLYNQEELNKIDKDLVNHIGENGGQAPDEKRKDAKKSVDLSHMTEEERAAYEESIRRKKAEAVERAKKKAQKDEKFKKQWEEWTDEQREEWLQKEAERLARNEELKKAREEFKARITNIRGIALRIPLLMYGGADAGDPKEDLTVENFTRKIKDESWAEFMPKGISKEDFNKIRKCFNATRFEEAGKKYRALTREADFMHVNERIKQIAEIFSYFHNPDKETVLTPWRVVNMHMSETIGGYCFYDETFDEKTGQLDTPRFVDQGGVTKQLFDNVDLSGEVQTKILEINSKTGLYPLYVTYSLYRRRLEEYVKAECIEIENVSVQEEQVVWDDIVTDNMFVICNTPMAVGITRRTLFGFRQVEKKANIKAEKLIERAIDDQKALIEDLKSVGFWKGNTSKKEMKFNIVVGNPPYQKTVAKKETDNGQKRVSSIFHHFQLLSDQISDYSSLIYPGGRWIHRSGKGLSQFGLEQINDPHLRLMYFFPDANEIFEEAGISDGISIVMKDMHKKTKGFDYVYCVKGVKQEVKMENPGKDLMTLNPYDSQIVNKINDVVFLRSFSYLHDSVLSQKLFSIESDFVEKNPSKVREYNEGDYFDKKSEIKLFANDKAGKAGRARWYITNREEIKTGKQFLDNWKVIVSSANAGGQKRSNQLAIVDNYSAFGRARVALKTFKTEKEAQNFYKYVKSDLIRFAFLMTDEALTSLAMLVPDIIYYDDNNGLINFNADVNEQVYDLFGIDDINVKKYIKEVLSTKADAQQSEINEDE